MEQSFKSQMTPTFCPELYQSVDSITQQAEQQQLILAPGDFARPVSQNLQSSQQDDDFNSERQSATFTQDQERESFEKKSQTSDKNHMKRQKSQAEKIMTFPSDIRLAVFSVHETKKSQQYSLTYNQGQQNNVYNKNGQKSHAAISNDERLTFSPDDVTRQSEYGQLGNLATSNQVDIFQSHQIGMKANQKDANDLICNQKHSGWFLRYGCLCPQEMPQLAITMVKDMSNQEFIVKLSNFEISMEQTLIPILESDLVSESESSDEFQQNFCEKIRSRTRYAFEFTKKNQNDQTVYLSSDIDTFLKINPKDCQSMIGLKVSATPKFFELRLVPPVIPVMPENSVGVNNISRQNSKTKIRSAPPQMTGKFDNQVEEQIIDKDRTTREHVKLGDAPEFNSENSELMRQLIDESPFDNISQYSKSQSSMTQNSLQPKELKNSNPFEKAGSFNQYVNQMQKDSSSKTSDNNEVQQLVQSQTQPPSFENELMSSQSLVSVPGQNKKRFSNIDFDPDNNKTRRLTFLQDPSKINDDLFFVKTISNSTFDSKEKKSRQSIQPDFKLLKQVNVHMRRLKKRCSNLKLSREVRNQTDEEGNHLNLSSQNSENIAHSPDDTNRESDSPFDRRSKKSSLYAKLSLSKFVNKEQDKQAENSDHSSNQLQQQPIDTQVAHPNPHISVFFHDSQQQQITLTQQDWGKFFTGVAMLDANFDKQQTFTNSLIDVDMPDLVRGQIWCKILNIDELIGERGTNFGLYQRLLSEGNEELDAMITKDALQNRSTLMQKDGRYFNADPKKIRNIIIAYHNLDISMGYNQGYNFIVALLLKFVPDEESAFWCLVVLMTELNWRDCFMEGMPMMVKLKECLPKLLDQNIPRLHKHMQNECAITAESMYIQFATRFVMPFFSVVTPIEISKFIMDYFLYQNCHKTSLDYSTTGSKFNQHIPEEPLCTILIKLLRHVEERCLKMEENELFPYLKSGTFVVDSFQEFKQQQE